MILLRIGPSVSLFFVLLGWQQYGLISGPFGKDMYWISPVQHGITSCFGAFSRPKQKTLGHDFLHRKKPFLFFFQFAFVLNAHSI